MQSTRTTPDECGNGENLKREHTGQGVLNLFTTNVEDYIRLFPLLDWQALNGITVEHDIPLIICNNSEAALEKRHFVGGVSDTLYGLVLMDTATHNLTAKRSWHFYDDAIVALATNLTLTTPNLAWTTLASRLFNKGQVTIGFFNSTIITLADGQYSSLGVDISVKAGNYLTIGPYNYTVTARTLTLWLDHGGGSYTLDYQYMILPNISLESMPKIIKQYDEEDIFSCISTNNLFHGVVWPSLKRASFVLWNNITTTFSCKSPLFEINLELNNTGAYLFSETDTDFTITASQPVWINGNMTVIVDRIRYSQGCTLSSNMNASQTDVVLTLPTSLQSLGASVQTICKKQHKLF